MSRRKHKPRVSHEQRFGPWPEHYGRECDPTYQLEAHIASLRDTDPEKWALLNLEWRADHVGS